MLDFYVWMCFNGLSDAGRSIAIHPKEQPYSQLNGTKFGSNPRWAASIGITSLDTLEVAVFQEGSRAVAVPQCSDD